MANIDEIVGSEGAGAGSSDHSKKESGHGDEIHIPHVPLTGTQKLVCVVELILAGLLTVFIFSNLIRHIIDLPGRI
jgi:hypothetical protein